MPIATPFRMLNDVIRRQRQVSARRRGDFLRVSAIMLAALTFLSSRSTTRAAIVVSGDFGPEGDVGFVNSPPDLTISFGSQGSVYQLDGFVNVAGHNLNNSGTGFGTSADLSYGAPTGIAYTFSAAQPTPDQLVLRYQLTNTSGVDLPTFQFLSVVDGDIGPDFADESAVRTGVTSPAGADTGAASFQVGDPSSSTLFTNLLYGTLDDSNDFTPATPGDVATGLGFAFDLAAGQSVRVNVLLSDDLSTLGLLALTQTDPGYLTDTLTVSGNVTAVPEPSITGMVAVTFLSLFRRSRRHRQSSMNQRSRPRVIEMGRK